MNLFFQTVTYYFSKPMMQNAMIVGILIALCTSILGVSLVLKRFSFIGDGLSHVAFGALCIATVLHVSGNMLIVLPITIITAILLLRTRQSTRIKGDAAIAMISSSSMGLGYLLVCLFPASANTNGDVCTTLFGSDQILTLTKLDVILCIGVSILVLLFFILFYRQIFAVTFDESFAAATGVRAGLYNLMIAIITALVIVLAMNLVGSLLISALIIFPALSAMRVFKNFLSVILCAGAISVFAAALGIMISLMGTPVGPTIVAVNIVIFLLFTLIGKLKGARS